MEFIRPNTNIDFVGKAKIATILSALLILAGLVSLVVKGGPSYGVDFSGGVLIQTRFAQPTDAKEIRDAIEGLNLEGVVVQHFGDTPNEFMIRARDTGVELSGFSHRFQAELEKIQGAGSVEIRRAELVGPQVGKDLRKKGVLAVLYSILGILVYVGWRFQFRYAAGAILALVHDVLVTLTFFSLLNKEIDLTVIAAFLTIIGFSVNDTIVIYDRIRENIGKFPKEDIRALVNRSLNETLSRTILTSGTVLLVVLALYFFGGAVIHDFAFAMLIGLVAGVYSTIYIATPYILLWEKKRPGGAQIAETAPEAAGRKG